MLLWVTMNIEDQIYIGRIKNGQAAAYAFLVDKYQHMVYTIAIKILINTEDAEDAAQESFIKAYQQINTFAGKSKFSTWLYTIAYRTAVSKLKENRVSTVSISDQLNENYTADSAATGMEQLQAKQQQEQVTRAIAKLPATEALLVTLYHINELPTKEIQEITGLSLSNIKIQLFRARKKLERELRFLLENEAKKVY
jgi:RNA polymerase sigma factor (sigma-70 family)